MGTIDELLNRLTKRFAEQRREGTYHECRHCGTTLSADAAACPNCGRQEIADMTL